MPSPKKICPSCGGLMDPQARRCRWCAFKGARHPRYGKAGTPQPATHPWKAGYDGRVRP